VNSSYFGLVKRVDSISRAVALLGMKNLHNLTVTDALMGMFRSGKNSGDFSYDQLWIHSVATGICCKMIAERIFSINGDDMYLIGIIHDIGLVAESQIKKQEFLQAFDQWSPERPSIVEHEQEYLETDHCEIGYRLAMDWHLATTMAEAIRDHHTADEQTKPQSPAGILQMSEYIVTQLGFSVKEGINVAMAPSLQGHIKENVAEYQVLAEELPEEVSRIREVFTG
jgi:HD-like signal output (HDOD) protein